MIDEIWKQANNSQLVGRNILLPDDVASLTRDGLEFVVMTVPRAEREEKPITIRDKKKKKDIAFVRRGTGDCEATENDLALMRYDNARNADRGPLDRLASTRFVRRPYVDIVRFLRGTSLAVLGTQIPISISCTTSVRLPRAAAASSFPLWQAFWLSDMNMRLHLGGPATSSIIAKRRATLGVGKIV